jgi:predicted aldo/keto reductase-like oxidoreductase
MKADKKIRYIGITTSHGRYHGALERILKKHPFDFVQLSYNIGNRDVEEPLLSIAKDKGIAVIVNRPFQRGDLFSEVRGKALPSWTRDFDCQSWGQFFLKFAVSHPAVTCAIPATSKVKHMKDNMQAGIGRLPTASERAKMIRFFESL